MKKQRLLEMSIRFIYKGGPDGLTVMLATPYRKKILDPHTEPMHAEAAVLLNGEALDNYIREQLALNPTNPEDEL